MNKILKHVKQFLDDECLELWEVLNSATIENKLNRYTASIDHITDDPYKRDIMKAITYEEQIHQYPLQTFIEDHIPAKIAQFFDVADSVGPSQIRVSLWADHYNTNRQDLIKPETHFVTMNKHIDFILSHTEEKQLPFSPEWIGTLWHNMNARHVSSYGERVLKYYDALRSDGGTIKSDHRPSS
jgi:hypothetical protein